MHPLEFDGLPPIETLVAGVHERGVAIVHCQRLDLRQHLGTMSAFGPIQATTDGSAAGPPLVRTIDGAPRTSAERARIAFDEQFHADLSWCPDVVAVTSLWADAIGPGAPATSFIDCRAAVTRLPVELVSSLRGQRAHHHVRRSREIRHPDLVDARASESGPTAVERLLRRLERRRLRGIGVPLRATPSLPPPGRAVPVIDADPRSGADIVRLGDHAWTIEGMTDAEGTALVDRCNDAISAGGADHVHHWAAGDLVVFDNRLVLHRREPAANPGMRRLRRIVALADE